MTDDTGAGKIVARFMRLQYVERAIRTGKVSAATYQQPGYVALSVNGVIQTEIEDVYPSEDMVAKIALGVGI